MQENYCRFYLKPTDAQEIHEIVNKMQNTKRGVDGISSNLIKLISINIVQSLGHLFNQFYNRPRSLESCWSDTHFENGKKYLAINYRPDSLISNVAKIYEKLLHNRIINFINKFNIISYMQYSDTRQVLKMFWQWS